VTDEELAGCPFCEGREDRTPPETLALGRASGEPDTPGWRVRIVPNLYPAFQRQEVVVHVPRHARSLADLSDDELGAVARAWRERRKAVADGYLHALVNEGRAAGASLAHSHSQLVWLSGSPPALELERSEACGVCEELGAAGDLLVAERDGLVLRTASAGRAPYELLIAPLSHEGSAFTSERLSAALQLLADAIRRLRIVEGHVPWNAWLHDGEHWHLEVLPRLTVFAGIELGAGLYVNTLAPEAAAAALREAPA
jgi:UDPglucose--hexose-1-phosphate uridylyltransferase